MKIALVTAYFYPTSSGGTEKYVLNLAKSLISKNNNVDIITAGESGIIRSYQDIIVYEVKDELSIDEEILSSRVASSNLNEFNKILRNNKYDLIHFHTLTPTFNTFHISAAKALKAEIHFTAHIPGITCIHGDLMLFGDKACDGVIKKQRCTACYISKKGLSKPVSKIIANAVNALNYPKSIATVVERKNYTLSILNKLCDKIFLFTNWQKEVFIKNGFNERKISVTSQLLDKKLAPQKPSKKKIKNIGFVGRISNEKGLHILIEAFKKANRKDLNLYIAGIINDEAYFTKLKITTEKDINIHWEINLSENEIDTFYRKIDTLVIPSITYETGPFVLYEALERNIPVIANNLGDIKIWQNRSFKIKIYNSILNLKEYIQLLN